MRGLYLLARQAYKRPSLAKQPDCWSALFPLKTQFKNLFPWTNWFARIDNQLTLFGRIYTICIDIIEYHFECFWNSFS